MTKNLIPDLLNELKSTEAYERNDAIKKIIKGKINDEKIITALKEIIENDPSMAVRNFARAALDAFGVEHSAVEVPMGEQEHRHNQNETINTVDGWASIGFFVGLIPGLLFFLFTRNQVSLLVFNTILVGPAGVIGGIIGASIGKQGDKSTVIGLSFAVSILGAFFGLFRLTSIA